MSQSRHSVVVVAEQVDMMRFVGVDSTSVAAREEGVGGRREARREWGQERGGGCGKSESEGRGWENNIRRE